MQILRYMACIWEDYEKKMEKEHPGISSRKDFLYPPILPIVYYEGTGSWTAPTDLADKILCRELLGKYLPHFQYQLVRLHSYSNQDLLEKGDEISLAMLINKIQTYGDVEAFASLPAGATQWRDHTIPVTALLPGGRPGKGVPVAGLCRMIPAGPASGTAT